MKLPQRWSRRWRRFRLLALAVILFPLLGLLGLMGTGQQRFQGERFISKVIVIRPDGDNGVRITENVEVNFGAHFRHGYERVIPHNLGIPTNVKATSTANPTLSIESEYGESDVGAPPYEEPSTYDWIRGDVEYRTSGFGETLIRVGSPDETFVGTERYTLSYTLPHARLAGGKLRLNIVENDETLRTERFEVIVDGFKMSRPTCSTGPADIYGGCNLELNDDRTYRALIEPLEAGAGITIGGDDLVRTDLTEAAPTTPALAPDTRPGWQVALILLAAEGAVVAVIYLLVAFVGANRVAVGGPTEAAFAIAPDTEGKIDTKRVADGKLGELATIQFEPPRGVRPWQGTVAMNEQVDARSVGAWVAEMVARGVMRVDGTRVYQVEDGDTEGLDEDDLKWIARLFDDRKSFSTIAPPSDVAQVWNSIGFRQEISMRKSGWWLKRPPEQEVRELDYGPNWSVITFFGVLALIALLIFSQAIGPIVLGLLSGFTFLTASIWTAIGLAVLGVGYAMWKVVRTYLPVRSVQGSAVALQVMSFRNFLTGSEGFHVDEAWDRSRVREYSAWAVALDAADAWAETLGEMGPTLVQSASIGTVSLGDMAARITSAIEYALTNPSYQSLRTYNSGRADPWGSIINTLKNADWGSGGGSSGWSSGGGGSSGGFSSRVGGGGGGGRSGTW